jgi:NADH-quinone oxidoreductase subunit N
MDLRPIVPALIVAVTGLVALLSQAYTPKGRRAPAASLSLVGLLAALVAVALLASSTDRGRGATLGGTLAADDFALFGQALVLLVGILTVLLSPSYLRSSGIDRGEYYALVLFSPVGMMGMVAARELISLFVALEIMSVALYALAGMRREQMESQESAVKYFITGAFASSFLLYGIASQRSLGEHVPGRIASPYRGGAGHPALALTSPPGAGGLRLQGGERPVPHGPTCEGAHP